LVFQHVVQFIYRVSYTVKIYTLEFVQPLVAHPLMFVILKLETAFIGGNNLQ
jgi:hypothetical protein